MNINLFQRIGIVIAGLGSLFITSYLFLAAFAPDQALEGKINFIFFLLTSFLFELIFFIIIALLYFIYKIYRDKLFLWLEYLFKPLPKTISTFSNILFYRIIQSIYLIGIFLFLGFVYLQAEEGITAFRKYIGHPLIDDYRQKSLDAAVASFNARQWNKALEQFDYLITKFPSTKYDEEIQKMIEESKRAVNIAGRMTRENENTLSKIGLTTTAFNFAISAHWLNPDNEELKTNASQMINDIDTYFESLKKILHQCKNLPPAEFSSNDIGKALIAIGLEKNSDEIIKKTGICSIFMSRTDAYWMKMKEELWKLENAQKLMLEAKRTSRRENLINEIALQKQSDSYLNDNNQFLKAYRYFIKFLSKNTTDSASNDDHIIDEKTHADYADNHVVFDEGINSETLQYIISFEEDLSKKSEKKSKNELNIRVSSSSVEQPNKQHKISKKGVASAMPEPEVTKNSASKLQRSKVNIDGPIAILMEDDRVVFCSDRSSSYPIMFYKDIEENHFSLSTTSEFQCQFLPSDFYALISLIERNERSLTIIRSIDSILLKKDKSTIQFVGDPNRIRLELCRILYKLKDSDLNMSWSNSCPGRIFFELSD